MCCATYTISNPATGIPGAGECLVIRLKSPDGTMQGFVKKIIASTDPTTASDSIIRLRVKRVDNTGPGLTSATPAEMYPEDTPASTVCETRQVSTLLSPGGTVETYLDLTMMYRSTMEWVARDKDDYIWVPDSTTEFLEFTVVMGPASSGTPLVSIVTVTFGE
jgi:hypothetical protein